MTVRYFITGATGFVGGHLAEACAARGYTVSTIARPTSDTALLERLGVTVYRGDLADLSVVQRALEEAEVVVHCAAKVGDWGPVDDYRALNVHALRGLLEVCKSKSQPAKATAPPSEEVSAPIPLRRFIHVSTLGVYAARHHYGTDESELPPARHIDGYTQTKVEAERLVLDYYRSYGVPAVVLRP
jgi:nucleoside-diphosphate-sugar epimerase